LPAGGRSPSPRRTVRDRHDRRQLRPDPGAIVYVSAERGTIDECFANADAQSSDEAADSDSEHLAKADDGATHAHSNAYAKAHTCP
jgi:hypothetical protein